MIVLLFMDLSAELVLPFLDLGPLVPRESRTIAPVLTDIAAQVSLAPGKTRSLRSREFARRTALLDAFSLMLNAIPVTRRLVGRKANRRCERQYCNDSDLHCYPPVCSNSAPGE